MSPVAERYTAGEAPRQFAARCASLGAVCWTHQYGRLDPPPAELLPQAAAWLTNPALQHRMASALAGLATDRSGERAELFPGCELIVYAWRTGSRCLASSVVMILTPRGLADPGFASLCAPTDDPVAVARQLSAALHLDRRDPADLREVLAWTHQDMAAGQRDRQTLDEISGKLIEAYEEVHLLFRLARFMNCVTEPQQVLEAFCQQLQALLPFGWLAAKFRQGREVSRELAGRVVLVGQAPFSQESLLGHVDAILDHKDADDWTRLLTPGSNALADLSGSEVLVESITHDGVPVGALLAGGKGGDDPEVCSVEMQLLDASADFLGVFHQNVARFEEQRTLFFGSLHALTSAIDAKDRYTCGHSERVAWLGEQLARLVGMDELQVERIKIAGLVHDVGKIGIPEAVLQKPGRLSDEEFEQIKQHPVIGHRILKDIPPMSQMLPGVLYHHERWDGRGYPEGLAGEAIPLFGRVLALADTFDAMSSTRSYRSGMARSQVLEEIRRCAGSQFDPDLARVFLKLDLAGYDQLLQRHLSMASEAA